MTPNDVITSSTRRTHCATLLAVGPWPPPWRDNGKHNKTFPSELIMFGFAAQSLLLRPLSWARAQATPVCMTFWRSKSCLKTNKSAAKRFRVQGNGKLKRCVFVLLCVLMSVDSTSRFSLIHSFFLLEITLVRRTIQGSSHGVETID